MEIVTVSHKPDPHRPGYSLADKVFSNEEVLKQIKDVLRSIKHPEEGNALEHLEYVFYEKIDVRFAAEDPFPFPAADILVSVDNNCCSGYSISMLVKDNSGEFPVYHNFCQVKYLMTDTSWLYQICEALRVAFYEGRFC